MKSLKNALKLITITVLLSCLLIGCRRNSDIEVDNLKSDDIQYINRHYSITDEVWVSSLSEGITYTDFIDGSKVFACNKLNCSHKPGTACLAHPDEKGGGFFEYPFLYNDKLYYFNERYADILLISSNPDGSDKEVLAELDFGLQGSYILRVGSKLYYWGKVEEKKTNQNGFVETLSANCEIYEADLETGAIRQLSSFGTYYGFNVDELIYSDGYIYFSYLVQQRDWKDTPYTDPEGRLDAVAELSRDEYIEVLDIKNVFGRIDIKTGQQELHSSNFLDAVVAVTKERIFVVTENEEELTHYDKNWQDKTVLYPAEMMEKGTVYVSYMIDNQLIVWIGESHEEIGKYYIWDDNKNDFRELEYDLDDYFFLFEASSANKLLIGQVPLNEPTTSDEWNYILADKESFFKGELVYTEVEGDLYE